MVIASTAYSRASAVSTHTPWASVVGGRPGADRPNRPIVVCDSFASLRLPWHPDKLISSYSSSCMGRPPTAVKHRSTECVSPMDGLFKGRVQWQRVVGDHGSGMSSGSTIGRARSLEGLAGSRVDRQKKLMSVGTPACRSANLSTGIPRARFHGCKDCSFPAPTPAARAA